MEVCPKTYTFEKNEFKKLENLLIVIVFIRIPSFGRSGAGTRKEMPVLSLWVKIMVSSKV